MGPTDTERNSKVLLLARQLYCIVMRQQEPADYRDVACKQHPSKGHELTNLLLRYLKSILSSAIGRQGSRPNFNLPEPGAHDIEAGCHTALISHCR